MRYLLPIKQRLSAGFTLVEILIIAPIVVLMIGGFVGLMITMVGDVLSTRDNSTLSYDTQNALNRIEQDTRLSTQFLTTSGTLTSPQGSDSNYTGTAAFTNTTNTLILSELATDQNPANTARWLIYYANQPNPCGASQQYNRPFLTKVMYFINNGSLWRRTVLPTFNTNPPASADINTICSTPWQENQCSAGYVAARCQTNDEEIMKNVNSLTVQYFSSPNSTTNLGTSGALSATTINVTINAQKTSAGRSLAFNGAMRTTRLNSIDTTQTPPGNPVVTHSTVTPNSISFSWPAIPTATSYQIGYQINGGTWITSVLDQSITQYTITANRNDVISFRAASFNAAGLSGYGTDSATLPAWTSCSPQNGWAYFGSGYAPPAFTKTSDNVIMLKGMVSGGTSTAWTTLCTLPVGYRPTANIIFANTSGGAVGRIDVLPDGEVQFAAGSNSWTSLDGISFIPSSAPFTWTPITPTSGWVNYGGVYSVLQGTQDTTGRIHLQGLIKNGTYTNTTPVGTLPPGFGAGRYIQIPETSTAGFNYTAWDSTYIYAKGIAGVTYYAIQAMYYPSSFLQTSWTAMPMSNSWVAYNSATYPPPEYTKSADGIVTVSGLIKSGTTTAGTVIGTLPAGFRPLERMLFTVAANGAWGRVDVLTNGQIIAESVSATWTSLDSITFMGDQ